MTKSTQKVIGTVNMSDADLNKILKNRGYPGDAKAFKDELDLFKQEKKFATSGSQADVARLQKISKDVFTASREKATRLDTARLKSIEKSMNGLSTEARAMAQRDIVDGQERLRATREANLTREGKSGYRLGKAPDIPATSKIPAGNWFLNGMGVDPSSTVGKFFGPPSPNSKIVKYGGPALIPLALLMANQIVQSKVHEVADDEGIVFPTIKLTGLTLIEMADFAGVSPKQFIDGMKGDLNSVQKNIEKWGLKNTPLEASALVLAAAFSPIKSIVKGGGQMVYQLGSSVVEVGTLAATLPSALYQSWSKMSAVEKRMMTDKLFRQASIMTNRRRLLPELELEIAIDTLAAGLSTKLVGSPALVREFLESSIEAETLRDEAAIKRWEAKTGKLSAQQKAGFLKERDERRRAKIKNPFERWDRAADAQKGLGARLTDIAAELAKGRGAHSLEELEKLQNDFKTIKDEIELFKGIVDRMSEMDRKAIFAQDAANLGAGRNSIIGVKELVQLKGYRDWVKGYDRMQGRMGDMLHGARGLDNLIYDAKAEQDQNGLPSLDDLLGQLGDPTKLTIDDLAGLIAIGMDVGAVFDALTTDGEGIDTSREDLNDALDDLKDKNDQARKKHKEKRIALKKEKQKKPAKIKIPEPAEPERLWGTYSGAMTGTMTMSTGEYLGMVSGGTLSFSIMGTKLIGQASATLNYGENIDHFSGEIFGNFNPKTGIITGKILGHWSGSGGSGALEAKLKGLHTNGSFEGTWEGGFVNDGKWTASQQGTTKENSDNTAEETDGSTNWDAYLCKTYPDAWDQMAKMGVICK